LVDCSWNWNWSACIAIAGQRTRTDVIGQRTGTFNWTINPLNGGRTCPVPPYIQNCIIPITNISGADISGSIDNSTDKFMIFTTTTRTSNFTVRSEGVICDILMIGGGGAGGQWGGGGAGACIVAIGHTLPGGDYNVTVGAGGIAGYRGYTSGSDSSISTGGTTLYLAKGGGLGAAGKDNGYPGGCGGGGGVGLGSTRSRGGTVSTNIVNGVSTGPTNQPTYAVFGNNGGDQQDNTYNLSTYTGAGGGGIGAAGENHANGVMVAGQGGAGLNQATINGIPYNFKSYFANNLNFGINNPQFVDTINYMGYIGGGGSGMTAYYSTQALGGVGGGGRGGANITGSKIVATPGEANTGSGGGSGQQYGGNGSGGSGIVIIRYRS
jgi:hypothetical protein